MKKIKFQVVPFSTKLRWLFIGKRPLERKSRPKILEYIFFALNNIVALVCIVAMMYWLINLSKNNNNQLLLGVFIKGLQESFLAKVLITIIAVIGLINFVLSIHTYYILSKTEFYKWIPVLGTIMAILFLSPFAIILFLIAYKKNDLAFE
ncbi:hypothetical protein [Mycoplasma bradburyae]|uniref:ABC3 transporter permease protein domain-containing protein n=1 Tax=Mycoplasma bradburyae TaxID=2963128 RepID=A0AAW6HMT0_9MOLU|nr:hypothetical protein [Mycoplasma bradburyae]MDC4183152.1 hypothetical protein [Mycoplasma bradburyae]UTS70804.1 hypothetical protein NMG77_03575 [Mycoplasma bradburyae]